MPDSAHSLRPASQTRRLFACCRAKAKLLNSLVFGLIAHLGRRRQPPYFSCRAFLHRGLQSAPQRPPTDCHTTDDRERSKPEGERLAHSKDREGSQSCHSANPREGGQPATAVVRATRANDARERRVVGRFLAPAQQLGKRPLRPPAGVQKFREKPEVEVVVDDQRCVVAEALREVDRLALGQRGNTSVGVARW